MSLDEFVVMHDATIIELENIYAAMVKSQHENI